MIRISVGCRILALVGLAATSHAALAADADWVGAFGHVPTAYNLSPPVTAIGRDGNPRVARPGYAPLPAYSPQTTVREVVRIGAAARAIRIRFSNESGVANLRIGEAHVALSGENGSIIPDSDRILTFAGQGSVVVPAGAPMLSDTVTWNLPALSRLSVSVFYPEETVPPAHTLYALDAWAAAGNQAGAEVLKEASAARSGNHLSQVDVMPQMEGHTVVCLGDSITEGVVSTVGAFRSWPDRLADRLQEYPPTRGWSVVNAGVGSNRLLHDTPSVNALARFDRDVLSVPGVGKVIILMGINDIQYSRRNPSEAVNADEMIAALRQLVWRAHARGIGAVGGTITPFEGSGDYTPDGEAARSKVNVWIRTSGVFDQVVDFDRAIRDPLHSTQLSAAADSGGHLHPNDTGYAAMADTIDLKMFQR